MVSLHWACDRGHLDIVKCLIENGANVLVQVITEVDHYVENLLCNHDRMMKDRHLFIMVSSFFQGLPTYHLPITTTSSLFPSIITNTPSLPLQLHHVVIVMLLYS